MNPRRIGYATSLLAVFLFYIFPTEMLRASTLEFDTLTLNDGQLQFEVLKEEPNEQDPDQLPESINADSLNKRFRLVVDLGNVRPVLAGTSFLYEVYLKKSNSPGWEHFRVRAKPAGNFADRLAKVTFTASDGAIRDPGELSGFPIHTRAGGDFLSLANEDLPLEINLLASSTIPIQVKNSSSDLNILVRRDITLSPAHGEYWKQFAGSTGDQPDDIKVDSGKSHTILSLKVEPNFLKALAGSVMATAPGKGHDVITLGLQNKTEYGGADQTTELKVPVRFVPTLWSLLMAVVLGALLGSLASFVIGGKQRGVAWWQSLVAALLIALIAEIVGIVAMINNSKFILFAIDLDPRQVVPAFLLGTLVGLSGVSGASRIRDILTRTKQTPAAAAAGD